MAWHCYTVTAMPFYVLANRGNSCQEVWVPQDGWQPTSAWWEGKLYRAWRPAGG
jgi:hypothetical protein